ncbi:MAG TPA: FKBP-type peptidyl-prolyl cis-trans isomerase [Puia sp.]|nr:FKBP-type peptidyl-prolyl cis-trans isomerase [Puia sp.]
MKKMFLPVCLILCMLFGCKEKRKIAIGDCVALDCIERTAEGAILSDSRDDDRSMLIFREKSLFKDDLFAALGTMGEGDSATFHINLDSLTAKMGLRRPDTKSSYLVFTIKVNKIIPRDMPPGRQSDSLLNNKIEAFKKAENLKARDNETSKIDRYIHAKGLHPVRAPSGLQYTILQEGKGPRPISGDSVLVNYTASVLSGKVFETTDETTARQTGIFKLGKSYRPLTLSVRADDSLSGFEEALTMFPKGTKVQLIIPSKLAYGEHGRGNIHAYTPLLCKMEILDISGAPSTKTPAQAP